MLTLFWFLVILFVFWISEEEIRLLMKGVFYLILGIYALVFLFVGSNPALAIVTFFLLRREYLIYKDKEIEQGN